MGAARGKSIFTRSAAVSPDTMMTGSTLGGEPFFLSVTRCEPGGSGALRTGDGPSERPAAVTESQKGLHTTVRKPFPPAASFLSSFLASSFLSVGAVFFGSGAVVAVGPVAATGNADSEIVGVPAESAGAGAGACVATTFAESALGGLGAGSGLAAVSVALGRSSLFPRSFSTTSARTPTAVSSMAAASTAMRTFERPPRWAEICTVGSAGRGGGGAAIGGCCGTAAATNGCVNPGVGAGGGDPAPGSGRYPGIADGGIPAAGVSEGATDTLDGVPLAGARSKLSGNRSRAGATIVAMLSSSSSSSSLLNDGTGPDFANAGSSGRAAAMPSGVVALSAASPAAGRGVATGIPVEDDMGAPAAGRGAGIGNARVDPWPGGLVVTALRP